MLTNKNFYIKISKKNKIDLLYERIKKFLTTRNLKEQDIQIIFKVEQESLNFLNQIKKIINLFPDSFFSIQSNFYTLITDRLINCIEQNKIKCIRTSWDYKIRFLDYKTLKIWQHNITELQDNNYEVHIKVKLTSLLLKINPKKFLDYMEELDVRFLDFEFIEGKLSPELKALDLWLYKIYLLNKADPKLQTLHINIFNKESINQLSIFKFSKHIKEKREIKLKIEKSPESIIIEAIEERKVRIPEFKLKSLTNPQPGNIMDLCIDDSDKTKPLDFIFPKSIKYSIFKEKCYGKISSNLSYYCYNLPLEYYEKHLNTSCKVLEIETGEYVKLFPELTFDSLEQHWTSSIKGYHYVNRLIKEISKDGFKQPLIFYLTSNAQLIPLCCTTRIMIASYLQLPTIPSVVILPVRQEVQETEDCRALAKKFLEPEIIFCK